jgi:hypothetical protein
VQYACERVRGSDTHVHRVLRYKVAGLGRQQLVVAGVNVLLRLTDQATQTEMGCHKDRSRRRTEHAAQLRGDLDAQQRAGREEEGPQTVQLFGGLFRLETRLRGLRAGWPAQATAARARRAADAHPRQVLH